MCSAGDDIGGTCHGKVLQKGTGKAKNSVEPNFINAAVVLGHSDVMDAMMRRGKALKFVGIC